MMETIIITILAVWTSLNLLYTIFNEKLSKYISRMDVFKWISAYQLFSEEAKHFQLAFRDRTLNGTKTDWVDIDLNVAYRWYHLIWFAKGLQPRTMMSALDDFVTMYKADGTVNSRQITHRFLYRSILAFVFKSTEFNDQHERQFRITEIKHSGASTMLNQVFMSDFHQKSDTL